MLIDDIAQHLHNQGIATLGTNLFKSYMPDGPDSAVCVIDTGGVAPERELDFKSPTFQVYIRSTTYALGKAKLDSVRDVLHGKSMQNLGIGGDETFFMYIFAISEGGHLGRDEADRDLFSINFICKTR